MIVPKASDAIHKAWLCRILTGIADDPFLAENLGFKGGTCAAMRGILDRFSVDLDFDLLDVQKNKEVQKHLEAVFKRLGLEVKDHSKKVPQYFLKYPNKQGQRNTVQFDVNFPAPRSSEYEKIRLVEIDRIVQCQTVPTMFANKLVATLERFEKFGSLAGRDIYDIHYFFSQGLSFQEAIIEERTGKSADVFLRELRDFIEQHFNRTIIDQDLNVLLPTEKFHQIRSFILQETLGFLNQAR